LLEEQEQRAHRLAIGSVLPVLSCSPAEPRSWKGTRPVARSCATVISAMTHGDHSFKRSSPMTSAPKKATPAAAPGPSDAAAPPVVFSHLPADEPANTATTGGPVAEKARNVLFSALTTS
jgi:hypothetical protein